MQRDREAIRQQGELERSVMNAAQQVPEPQPAPQQPEMMQPELPPEGMM
jgi:hypothetical protein